MEDSQEYIDALAELEEKIREHREVYQAQERGLASWHLLATNTLEQMHNAWLRVNKQIQQARGDHEPQEA